MSSRDVPYYAGFIIGAIAGNMIAQSFGAVGLMKTLGAIGGGVLGGIIAEYIVRQQRR